MIFLASFVFAWLCLVFGRSGICQVECHQRQKLNCRVRRAVPFGYYYSSSWVLGVTKSIKHAAG
jgi:hypothetical protein